MGTGMVLGLTSAENPQPEELLRVSSSCGPRAKHAKLPPAWSEDSLFALFL